MHAEPARPLLIGRKEFIGFPEWNISRLRAKVDTGAWSTALDVCDFSLVETGPGSFKARFSPVLNRKKGTCGAIREAVVVRMVMVRNTSGNSELRPVVETEVQLGPVLKRIRITLTDRSRMRWPVILGRTALSGDFVVDVSRKYLLRRSG
jgi:hypothetical protein